MNFLPHPFFKLKMFALITHKSNTNYDNIPKNNLFNSLTYSIMKPYFMPRKFGFLSLWIRVQKGYMYQGETELLQCDLVAKLF